ncbi:Hpt domain-containing protein [Nitratireductor sp.]|uniref:Hpt domain-containing protein n=1 Tax=Nitratireductor sp. TaxID=1872084 RepID=UPI0025E8A638|nr:Hpt domain-containing protein [Nitratireductor sp.]
MQIISGGLFDEGHSARGAIPFDLKHLARQTMGDEVLALEILGMFRRQIEGMSERMRGCDLQSRREMAHALVGSARGVGAGAIAACAAAIEKNPANDEGITQLAKLICEANEFISRLR